MVLHLSPPFLTIKYFNRPKFVIRPKGDVFLSFTTLLIESKCKKNSVLSPVLFTVLRLHCIHHTKFDLYRCGFDWCACFSINKLVKLLFHNPSSKSSKTRQQSPHPISPRQYRNSNQVMWSSIYQWMYLSEYPVHKSAKYSIKQYRFEHLGCIYHLLSWLSQN